MAYSKEHFEVNSLKENYIVEHSAIIIAELEKKCSLLEESYKSIIESSVFSEGIKNDLPKYLNILFEFELFFEISKKFGFFILKQNGEICDIHWVDTKREFLDFLNSCQTKNCNLRSKMSEMYEKEDFKELLAKHILVSVEGKEDQLVEFFEEKMKLARKNYDPSLPKMENYIQNLYHVSEATTKSIIEKYWSIEFIPLRHNLVKLPGFCFSDLKLLSCVSFFLKFKGTSICDSLVMVQSTLQVNVRCLISDKKCQKYLNLYPGLMGTVYSLLSVFEECNETEKLNIPEHDDYQGGNEGDRD